MSCTRSRCTARVVQHVYRQIQTFVLLLLPDIFVYIGPAKSTPVELKGESTFTRNSGSGGGAGLG